MITLQYLQELGNYTLLLYKDLKEGVSQPELVHRDLAFVHLYRYSNDNLICSVESKSPLTDNEIIRSIEKICINTQYRKMSFIKDTIINYGSDIEKYSTSSFEDDWFSLSTTLSDLEFVELYLCKVLQTMLQDTFDCGTRVLINPSLMHEYYTKIIKNEQ